MAQWRGVLDEMVRERRSALVAYACLFVVDRRDAEDLVHEAIVKTFSRPRVVTEVHAAEGYVRQAIRTLFLDQARSRRTRQAKAHLFGLPVAAAADGPAIASADVAVALRRLAPRERACIVLRYFDDLPVAEIAAELGLSDGAVKRYLSDGTASLRDSLRLAPGPAEELDSAHVIVREEGIR